jgi:hypothetical protein
VVKNDTPEMVGIENLKINLASMTEKMSYLRKKVQIWWSKMTLKMTLENETAPARPFPNPYVRTIHRLRLLRLWTPTIFI